MDLNKHKLMFFALSHLIKFILSQFLVFCHSVESRFSVQVKAELFTFSNSKVMTLTLVPALCPLVPCLGDELSLTTLSFLPVENL